MPRQHVENTKEFCSENEAKRANKHANRRIIYWPPFWNKVYSAKICELHPKWVYPDLTPETDLHCINSL